MSASWHAARVVSVTPAVEGVFELCVRPVVEQEHTAGQHYEIRLPGDEISRKYSVMSSPLELPELTFGIKVYPGGALSPRLQLLQPGDTVELRGPLGRSFIWHPGMTGPLVLIGAGLGITPLLAIFRHAKALDPGGEVAFVISAKSTDHIMHYLKIKESINTRLTATENRIDSHYLRTTVGHLADRPGVHCYVCGPAGFIDAIVDTLLELGFPADTIASERFV